MALFKILQGDSSRISTDKTPFHEGYVYFTPDDVKFYIDSIVNDERKRICINTVSTHFSETLRASNWVSGEQTLTIGGVSDDTNGMIGVSQSATIEQLEEVRAAELCVSAQGSNSITITALGKTPTCDIPVDVILMS